MATTKTQRPSVLTTYDGPSIGVRFDTSIRRFVKTEGKDFDLILNWSRSANRYVSIPKADPVIVRRFYLFGEINRADGTKGEILEMSSSSIAQVLRYARETVGLSRRECVTLGTIGRLDCGVESDGESVSYRIDDKEICLSNDEAEVVN